MFEVEKWLHSRIGLNFRSGLGRMQRAVDLLGNPEQTYPIIHVTGTNGKGSTIAFYEGAFCCPWENGWYLYFAPHCQYP